MHFQVVWRWIIVTLKSGLEVTQGHSNCSWYHLNFESVGAVSYSLSIVTTAVSCIVFEIKRDNGRKSWFFHIPLHSTPPVGRFPSEYCHPDWYGKTRMVWLLDDEKKLVGPLYTFSRFDRIPACDRRRTDRRTLHSHSPRYAYASRGKNY